jgi:ribonuclease HI
MNASTPHYLLCSETSRTDGIGQWRFMLRPDDGSAGIEVADVEPDVWGERLDLLTVVRALESLDHPSRVTLVGCTRYVEQGILYGVSEWRDNGWRWECFGQMVPVRDSDLWRRMDQVLQFHQVECGQRRIDSGHNALSGPHWSMTKTPTKWADRVVGCDWVRYYAPVFERWCDACIETASSLWQKATGFWGRGSQGRAWRDVAVRA